MDTSMWFNDVTRAWDEKNDSDTLSADNLWNIYSILCPLLTRREGFPVIL